MKINLELEGYTFSHYENDLLDAAEMVQTLTGKQFRSDGRVMAANRLLETMVAQHKLRYWDLMYAAIPKKAERHQKNCECGECFDALIGKMCYRGHIYNLHGALASRTERDLSKTLATMTPLVSFYGKARDTVRADIVSYCEKERWYLFDPLTRTNQTF